MHGRSYRSAGKRGTRMAFKEYGNYDAVGLAELVRKKQVTAA